MPFKHRVWNRYHRSKDVGVQAVKIGYTRTHFSYVVERVRVVGRWMVQRRESEENSLSTF